MIFNVLCCILFPLIVYLLAFFKIDKSLKKVEESVVDLNNKDCNITNYEALKQINKAYRNFEKLNYVILLGKDNKNYYLKRK